MVKHMEPGIQSLNDDLAILTQNLGELQLSISRSSIHILAPVVSDTVEQIRKQVDTLIGDIRQLEPGLSKMRALAETSQVLNSSLDPRVVLQNVMDTMIQLTGAERGFLMLMDSQGNMVTHIARNWEHDSITEVELQISQTIIQRVLSDNQPVLTTNASEDPRFLNQESVLAFNLRSVLCVPLKVKGKLEGVIYTDHRIQDGIFTETDRDTLMTFTNQAGIALENARLYSSIQRSLSEMTALKNLMESVFKSIHSGVITTDESNRIIFCNQASKRLLQVSPGINLLQHLQSTFPALADGLAPYWKQVQDTEGPVGSIELNPLTTDHGPLNLRVSLAPLRDLQQQKVRGMTVVVDDQTETIRLKARQRLFEKMVSPAVIQQLDPDAIHFGGSKSILTVLFADISGFTALGETVSPETLVSVANCYLSAAAEIVLEEGGTIDKFLGDSIMAWFNAPLPQADHALRAARTAWRIQQALPQIHCTLPEGHRLDFSIGIHTGDAVLGLIGSEKRMEYTAIGDAVNIAKRLQENAQPSQIILSARTKEEVGANVLLKRLDPQLLRGRREVMEVYELLGLNEKP